MPLKEISPLRKHIQIYSMLAKPTGGKTVKSRAISLMGADFGIARITTSEMIMWNIERKTALGTEYEKYLEGMKARQLVPCHLVLPGLADAVIRTHQQGFSKIIIDGSPRSEIQAKALVNCRVDFQLFEIDISDEEAVRRDAERRKFETRLDDGQILGGLKTYRDQTAPGIRLTKKAGLYHRIDGTRSIRSQIAKILREFRFKDHEFKTMMRKLDDANHPATVIVDEAEGRRKREEKPAYSPRRRNFWDQAESHQMAATA